MVAKKAPPTSQRSSAPKKQAPRPTSQTAAQKNIMNLVNAKPKNPPRVSKFPASASKSPTEPGSVSGIAHRRVPKSGAGATTGQQTAAANIRKAAAARSAAKSPSGARKRSQ